MDKRVEQSELMAYYGALLTERQRTLMEQYLDEDFSLAEIAERENISRQGVRDSLTHSEAQLYQYEAKLGFCARDAKLLGAISRLFGAAEAMDDRARMEVVGAIGEMRTIILGNG